MNPMDLRRPLLASSQAACHSLRHPQHKSLHVDDLPAVLTRSAPHGVF